MLGVCNTDDLRKRPVTQAWSPPSARPGRSRPGWMTACQHFWTALSLLSFQGMILFFRMLR